MAGLPPWSSAFAVFVLVAFAWLVLFWSNGVKHSGLSGVLDRVALLATLAASGFVGAWGWVRSLMASAPMPMRAIGVVLALVGVGVAVAMLVPGRLHSAKLTSAVTWSALLIAPLAARRVEVPVGGVIGWLMTGAGWLSALVTDWGQWLLIGR